MKNIKYPYYFYPSPPPARVHKAMSPSTDLSTKVSTTQLIHTVVMLSICRAATQPAAVGD